MIKINLCKKLHGNLRRLIFDLSKRSNGAAIKKAKDMATQKNIPAELIGKFETLADAAAALSAWEKEHRRPGRPHTKNKGVQLGTLKKMIKVRRNDAS